MTLSKDCNSRRKIFIAYFCRLFVSTRFTDKIHRQDSSTGFIDRIHRQDSSTGFIDRIYRQDLSTGFIDRIHRQDSSTGFIDRIYRQDSSTRFIDKIHRQMLRCGNAPAAWPQTPPTREKLTPTREMFGITHEGNEQGKILLDPHEGNVHSDSKLNRRNPTMEIKEAQSLLEELGHMYAVALAEIGHNVDDKSPLMNGLAAYFMLKLEGEFNHLDKAVDAICRIVYEGVREKLKQGTE